MVVGPVLMRARHVFAVQRSRKADPILFSCKGYAPGPSMPEFAFVLIHALLDAASGSFLCSCCYLLLQSSDSPRCWALPLAIIRLPLRLQIDLEGARCRAGTLGAN
jgi:hypothetical protein